MREREGLQERREHAAETLRKWNWNEEIGSVYDILLEAVDADPDEIGLAVDWPFAFGELAELLDPQEAR